MSDHPGVFAALAAAQNDCGPLIKNARNPHFKNTYATLNAVLELIEKPMADNDLMFFQAPKITQGIPTLETTIIHKPTGETIESEHVLVHLDKAQDVGSAITYARRYSLVCLFNLNAEDDDGQGASTERTTKPVEAKTAKPVPPTEIPDTETFKANVHNALLIANVPERKAKIKEWADHCLAWQSPEHNSILRAAVAHDNELTKFRDWFDTQLQAKLA